ncbi:MAG: methyltransferase domain-containing protein [Deltaproteobacteria bacterium]|nr:methyltransferase domain-containing protein [Deltaproteobacteria bacterium]
MRALLAHAPRLYEVAAYLVAARRLGDQAGRAEALFAELVASSAGLCCLQIGARDHKFAPHWTCVDLYDQAAYVDFHYDVQQLQFPDARFDVVVCDAILEHVPAPTTAIRELRRVLKPGGRVWVEVPFNQPYHPSPQDYWRVTPEGLQLWMRDFEPLAAGFAGSAIYNYVFFCGRKPA